MFYPSLTSLSIIYSANILEKKLLGNGCWKVNQKMVKITDTKISILKLFLLFTLFFNLDKDPESEKKHALITIATGYLSDAEVDSLGLVSTHAYAVLGNL